MDRKIINNERNRDSAAYLLDHGYFYIQTCEDGYDYTAYDLEFQEIDGGQLDAPELSIEQAAKELMEEYFPSCNFKSMSPEVFSEILGEL